MKTAINIAIVGLILSSFTSTAGAESHVRGAYEAAPHMGCNSVKTVAAWLTDGHYAQLSVGIGADGKQYETWVNKNNDGITWSFDKAHNSDRVERICVTGVYREAHVNDKVLAGLNP